ncbi:hypothetical protein CEE37_13450 [candidate division LCP-89 bacterium B3_LCP]|uniref:Uncharacterized protein n=1 Tax=candidate division LCP-89 bacterium B3_LCP TaxID=2012998 RepID=A0A532USU4_UNCL8|nr:MAG: hypothetical protein CEE37_13450 [candidate division LCP-89 bacterium B3_LCP]
MTIRKIFYLVVLLQIFQIKLYAQSDEIYASYKYVMGDNDTKNDAKRICFLEAKRLCIEKAGTYIESQTDVTNWKLTRDEIKTYAAALLKVEIVSEELDFKGESISISMTVKAEIEKNYIEEKIREIKENDDLQIKIKDQQEKIDELESEIRNIQNQLSTDDVDEVVKLRKKRKDAFENIDELEAIKYEIKKKTKLAVENIELGMTPSEVVRLIGEPRAIESYDGPKYNYGNVWVVFESGVVSCMIRAKYYNSAYNGSFYRDYKPQAIIK